MADQKKQTEVIDKTTPSIEPKPLPGWAALFATEAPTDNKKSAAMADNDPNLIRDFVKSEKARMGLTQTKEEWREKAKRQVAKNKAAAEKEAASSVKAENGSACSC